MILVLVVWGFAETAATFSPISALRSELFPTLGLPTIATKADFVSKLQIALKEANETSYWLLLLGKTNILSSAEYDRLETLCREIRITLIASINTTKQNLK